MCSQPNVTAKVEQRATRRFALQLPVTVKHPQKGEVAAHTRDISSRGICFYADVPFQVGKELEFTLTLPPEVTLTEAIRVRCRSRILRVEPQPGSNRCSVAAIIDRYEFLSKHD